MPAGPLTPRRIAPDDVADRIASDDGTRFVCAYRPDTAFAKFPLPGAIAWSTFEAEVDELDRGTPVVLYCRCPDDKTANGAAERLLAAGFRDVAVLSGGYRAWVDAGLAT